MNPSRIFTGIKRLGLSIALGAGLVGCAVLTVDVDVYKGALVNEEHVQLHQLASLATAAKPLLIGLRNNIEWPENKGKPPRYCSDTTRHWYEHGYISEEHESHFDEKAGTVRGDQTCREGFQRPLARRVNSILSLYEDLGEHDFLVYAKNIHEALDRLQHAQSILMVDQERDQERYRPVKTGLKPDQDLDRGLQDLLAAYRTILLPDPSENQGTPVRKVGKLMDALQAIAHADKKGDESKEGAVEKKFEEGIEEVLIEEWQGAASYSDKDDKSKDGGMKNIYERRLPFRAVWKLLRDGGENTRLAKKTRFLFLDNNEGEEAYKTLTGWIKELADAYWSSRQATRELWEASLVLLVQIDRLEQTKSEQKQSDRYPALKERVVNLATELTSVYQIASALDRVNSDGQCSVLGNRLTSGMTCPSLGPDEQAAWTEPAVRANPERFVVILRRALSTTPTDTAYFLLDLDSLEKHVPPRTLSSVNTLVKRVNRGSVHRMVRLGLNRSYIDDEKQNDQIRMVQSASELARTLAGGFERGRLLSGIHTLTENYLQSHDRGMSATEEKDEARLLDALVEFAQKVLFLANHEELASPPDTPGLLPGSGENLGRGLLGDRFMDFLYYTTPFSPFGSDLLTRTRRQYSRVLQAVGNSILFSANELRERERYREQGQKKVSTEVRAVNSIYSPDPTRVLTDLLSELEHEKDTAETELNDAQTRKTAIATQLGTPTNSKPGLYRNKATAIKELADVEQDLADYRKKLSQLEAIHHVLTPERKALIKTQWKESEAQNINDFFDNAEGLKKKILQARQLHDGTPTPDEIAKWNDATKYIESSDTRDAFEAYRAQEGHTSLKRSDLLDKLVDHIKWLDTERAKRIVQYEDTRNEKDAALHRIEQEIAALDAEATRLDKRILELPDKKVQFEFTKTEIESVKADVLKEANQGNQFVLPKTMYSLIDSHLDKKNTLTSKVAQKILSTRTPSPGMPPLNTRDYKSPIEVMDALIALLRHHQMDVVQRWGQDSDENKRATEAVENAYRHRAGMIYIRPSSTYLRTSFPSTSLQDDPNLAWDNMLLKQGLRNLPFSSELRDILNPSVKQDRSLTSELDKQYWQNINRVRVSGAGFTNQALVKDDVGNWYVKQYYGDTEDIAKSAKNLALFSLGTKMPIDLARELRDASDPKGDPEKPKNSPTLQKVLEKHQDAYKTHTDEVQVKLERLHTKEGKSELQESIIVAWDGVDGIKTNSGFRTSLHEALRAELREWDKAALALKSKADQDRGQAIVKDIRALSRLDKMLSARIGELQYSELLKAQAVSAIHRIVGGQVFDVLAGRNQALDRYEQAITFIGDAANPTDPNSK